MADTKFSSHGKKPAKKNDHDEPQKNNTGNNIAKQVNHDKSQSKTDLHTKNKVTGANLDAPPE